MKKKKTEKEIYQYIQDIKEYFLPKFEEMENYDKDSDKYKCLNWLKDSLMKLDELSLQYLNNGGIEERIKKIEYKEWL